MSQYPTYPPPDRNAPQASGGGLATAAFVLAIVGLVVPLLGVVALILGIVALAKGTANRGLAIASVCIAPVSLLLCVGSIGIFLPALGKAREAARHIKSSTQIRGIGQAMVIYAQNNNDWYPEPGADWQGRLLKMGAISREMLQAPGAPPGMESYYYIPGKQSKFDANTVILYENPDLWRTGSGRVEGGNVFYDDGHVEWIAGEKYQSMAAQLESQRRAAEAGARKGSGP
jgi:hypothetical protein